MAKNKRRRNREPGRTGSVIALCVALALTLFIGYLGFNGMWLDGRGLYKLLPWLPTADASAWPKPLSLGLDLRGGMYIEYTASAPENSEADYTAQMDGTIAVIRSRLDNAGRTEATVQRINDGTGIRVEVPDVSDSEEITDLIGKTARLSFRDDNGQEFMTGAEVTRASSELDTQSTLGYYIALELTGTGADLFYKATAEAAAAGGGHIGIYLDDMALMNPSVEKPIPGGHIMITGSFTAEEARNYAAQIQSGALPLVLTELNHATGSAPLCDSALSTAVTAAAIGIALIMIFMIARYRLNGVVASWALCVYIIVLFFLIALLDGIQLTLPGLAGIVLGIGMAVDANVVIYERFNEELRSGRAKSVMAAAKAGFKNAMSAILDANVTTMIAGVVLWAAGTGSVQGFAKTLLLSVLVSMLSAVLVTRFLMTRFIAAGFKDPKLFCKLPAAETADAKEVL